MAALMGKWYHEDLGHGAVHSMKFGDILYTATTPFQNVEVVQTEAFGYALMLDGVLNSAEKVRPTVCFSYQLDTATYKYISGLLQDEFIYHESLVHPAMLAHPDPQTVFIGGGGETIQGMCSRWSASYQQGGTLREVLRHPSVTKCVMVDIDGDLVEVFKKDLPQWHQGAFDDPRAVLIYDDAKKQLEEYNGVFDVIILDLADPVEAGPAFPIWTQEYYKTCFEKLSPNGVCVTQAGPLSAHQVSEICTPVAKTLASVFPTVLTYGCHIPSFGHMWAYNMALKKCGGNAPAIVGYADLTASEIDVMLSQRLGVEAAARLGWYDGETHIGMFTLPKPVRKALEAETRVVRMDTPLAFMAGVSVASASKL